MTQVSFYKNIHQSKDGTVITFSEVMQEIRGDKWKEQINKIRSAVSAGVEKNEVEKLKKSLPYFTASGTFGNRTIDGLIEHSGKLAIDFDKIENISHAKEQLKNDKFTEYLFLSCSGRGLCAIVNVEPEKHTESFNYLEKYYLEQYNLQIDKSCKDVSRARFVSHDENLIHNEFFQTVSVPGAGLSSATIDSDEEKFEWVLSCHNKKQSFIEGNRHNYLVILAYFCNKVGIQHSYTLNQLISRFSNPEKSEKEIASIVQHCYKSVESFGTLTINKKLSELPEEFSKATKEIYKFAFNMNDEGHEYTKEMIEQQCRIHYLSPSIVENIFRWVYENNKDSFGINNKPEIFKVKYFIKKKYLIRRNVVTQRIEYKNLLQPDDIANEHSIFIDLLDKEFKFSLDKVKSLVKTSFVESYDPIREYFETLPEWDGVDYIDALSDYVKTDNQAFWKQQFKKALVRMIACSIDKIENRVIMTLIGKDQETGKSSFIRFLSPPALKDYYTESEMDGSKDSDIQLSENFIWNIEELAILERSDINKLKAIISKSTIKQRKAYAEHAEAQPRRCNFWASTNKNDFLTDDQNTRWLCFNVLSVNHDYNNWQTGVKSIDINDVWAQAYALYKSGFKFTLTAEEREIRDGINKDFENSSLEKEIIIKTFKPAPQGMGEFLTTADILIRLVNYTDNKIKYNHITIGRAMKQLMFAQTTKKVGGRAQRGYWCYTADMETPGSVQFSDSDQWVDNQVVNTSGGKPF